MTGWYEGSYLPFFFYNSLLKREFFLSLSATDAEYQLDRTHQLIGHSRSEVSGALFFNPR